MFERTTTLILGAGASVPFGFPLSVDLHTAIIQGIDGLEAYVRNNHYLPSTSANNARMFARDGTVALTSYLSSAQAFEYLPENMPKQTIGQWLIKFRDDLKRQTHDSVDRFIADNPQHAFIGKCLLVLHVVMQMYDWEEGRDRYILNDFCGRSRLHRRNWYHQLINRLRSGAATAADLRSNKLAVVSFNYDLSLGCAMDGCFADTTRHAGADWRKIVPLFHVNGEPHELPREMHNVGKFIAQSAGHLQLVDEPASPDITQRRATVRGHVIDSDRVYVMGFHFDDDNVAAIGLRDHPNKTNVFCLNFSGHQGVAQRIRALGVPESNIRSGTSSTPLHIDVAIDEGFLEQ